MRVLFVDDDEDLNPLVQYQFEKRGYEIDFALNGKHAKESFDPAKHSVIIIDQNLPDTDGLQLLQSLDRGQTQAIILSGIKRDEFEQKAKELNALFIEKGSDLSFIDKIERVIKTK